MTGDIVKAIANTDIWNIWIIDCIILSLCDFLFEGQPYFQACISKNFQPFKWYPF